MDSLDLLLDNLGIGELPILNQDNQHLSNLLVAKQLEVAKLKSSNDHESDELTQMHSHLESVQGSSGTTKYFIQARAEELIGEKDLERVASLHLERQRKEKKIIGVAGSETEDQVEKLEENIKTREVLLDLLDEEHNTDLRKLGDWSQDVKEYESHIFSLLQCHQEDEEKVKSWHLKMEKLREKVTKGKAQLDETSTLNKMAQLALDKTAEEYRQLHDERQGLLGRWEEAVRMAKLRDKELGELQEKVNSAKAKARKRSLHLQEQENFLENERGNNAELERQIKDLERKCHRLGQDLEEREKALESVEGELVLEERETMKLGAEIASKRARLKDLKGVRNRAQKRVGVLSKVMEAARAKFKCLEDSAMTAEEKVVELELMLNQEIKEKDSLQWELDKTREKKFRAEHDLKEFKGEEEALGIKIKGLRIEKANLSKRIKVKKDELLKKEDIMVANDYKISQLEREIAELKGVMSLENRAELKRELEKLKEELAQRSSDKRNIEYLVHKIEADVRKISRELARLTREQERLKFKLEEVSLVSETSKRQHQRWQDELEALLLEEKLLMVNERKVKEELKVMNEALMELDQQGVDRNEETRKQKAELENQKELLAAQQKHLSEDLRFVKYEVRERRDKSGRLKIKYELVIKAMGDSSKFDEKKVPSHAFHLVKLAQEKSELQEQGEILQTKIEKEERDLLGLEKAMAMLRNSNDKYRANNFRRDYTDTEEVKELKAKVKEKNNQLEELKNKIGSLEAEIKLKEVQTMKSLSALEAAQAMYDEKSEDLKHLERESKDQELKLTRAEKSCSNLSRALRSNLPNADQYEHDMDLRAEKERQRSALIKLRELSLADVNFSVSCQAEIERLGLSVPTLSRLEMQTTNSSRRSSAMRRSTSMSRGLSSSGGPSFYRQSSRRSSSGSRMPSTTSMLVMELTETSGAGSLIRNGTSVPQLPVVH